MGKECKCQPQTNCDCPIKDLKSDCIIYSGENLENLNIYNHEILTDIIKKIDEEVPYFKMSMVHKGAWGAGISYKKNDVVEYDGSSYVSMITNNTQIPGTGNLWNLMAEKGDQGEPSFIVGATAEVNDQIGIPDVDVTLGGTPEERTFHFSFQNIKGDTFTFDDLTNEQKEQLKGDVIAYNSLDEADKDDLASRVPIVGIIEEGNTQAVSGGEVYKSFLKKGVADLESGSITTSTGELVNSNLRARTTDFLEGDSFVLTSDNLYVINILFYDQNDVFVQPLNVPDVREYSVTYPIGATKYKLALARSNRTEVVTPTDINNSELLYVSNEKYDFDAIDTFKPMKSDYDNAELDFNTSENELGGISTSTGIPGAPNNIRIRSKDFIYVEESKGYSVENITPGFVMGRIFRYLDGVFVGFTPYPTHTFTPDNTYNQVKFMFEKTNNTEVITPEELESFSFNIYSSIDDKITEIAERTSLIPKLEQRVTNLENQGEFNPWIGKKMVALGDSNTYGFIPYNDPGNPGQLDSFIKLSAEDLGMNFENFGISGSTLGQVPDEDENYRNPMVNRYDSMPDDADLILTMGGTNDLRFIRRLGVFDDRIKTTFKGALHLLYQGLMNKYVYDQLSSPKTIIAITPPKIYPDNPQGIEQLRIKDYRDAVIEVAGYYGIPVFDMWGLNGINPEEFRTLQGTAPNYTDMYNPLSPDGVHFTQIAHAVMLSQPLTGFIKSLK